MYSKNVSTINDRKAQKAMPWHWRSCVKCVLAFSHSIPQIVSQPLDSGNRFQITHLRCGLTLGHRTTIDRFCSAVRVTAIPSSIP